MLEVEKINSYYGLSHVLHSVTISVGDQELVCLLGRNGAGKSTTLKSILGLVDVRTGAIRYNGTDITSRPPYEIANLNICLVPEDRGIFRGLSVQENLMLGYKRGSPWTLERIYEVFPRLKERRKNGGAQLSGGEQQMLSIGRALMNGPDLLILDEPTEGLAPVIVDEIASQLAMIKKSGMAILLVEQNLLMCMTLGDRHYILESGEIVYEGTNEEFKGARDLRERYLSVG